MKWIFIIMGIFLTSFSFGQTTTFSRLYDLDKSISRNYTRNMIVADEQLIILSTKYCDQDSFYLECGVYAKFSFDGTLLLKKVNDSIATFYGGFHSLQSHGGKIYHSVNHLEVRYDHTFVYSYDEDFNANAIFSYPGPPTSSNIFNKGLNIVYDDLYIYGVVSQTTGGIVPDSIQIIKTDLEGNEKWRKYYSYGNSALYMADLQATADGNIAFILRINAPAGANNGFTGFQLMKIDTAGEILDSFVFEEGSRQANILLATSDGGYVFGSFGHPFNSEDRSSSGRIHKMDSGMDHLTWSFTLPNDPYTDGRVFRILDFTEASNGDILACGYVKDKTDAELVNGIPDDENYTWSGCIIRLTPDGEIRWLRLYKNPNDLLPQDSYGKFRPSRLDKIKELPDGRCAAAGNVVFSPTQGSAINENETEGMHLWLLVVDENGCLQGEECQEIIRLDDTIHYDPPIFSIGTKWTYDYFPVSNNPDEIVHTYIEFTLSDTSRLENELIYHISNNRNLPEILMKQSEDEIWFWHAEKQVWQLTYDFNANFSYQYEWDKNQFYTVHIDSVAFPALWFSERGFQPLQYVSMKNNGDTIASKVILRTCGSMYGGLTLKDHPLIGNIRCFEQDSFQHNFGPFYMTPPCDTTWIEGQNTTTDVALESSVALYPNPVRDILHIVNFDVKMKSFKIYNQLGTVLQKGYFTEEIDVSDIVPGLYFVQLHDQHSNYFTLKFIKL